MTAAAVLLSMLFAVFTVYADDTDEEENSVPVIEMAQSAYLYNFENDRVLYEYNSAAKVFPTSTVKLMTALVAFDVFGDALDTEITVTQTMLNEVTGNAIGFSAGEIVTVEQLLNCMLINSANDAAIILAFAAAGGIDEFVEMMNAKAAELGADDTNYTNCTGMHDSAMFTTARDTALISIAAYNTPGLVEITSTPKYVMPATNTDGERNIYNRNAMISKYYSAYYYYGKAVGLNAGATTQGGCAICAVAEDAEKGLTYLAVVLGADDSSVQYNYINAEAMLEWAFKAYSYIKVLSTNRVVCEIPVELSSVIDYVTLVPSKDISVYLPSDIDIDNELHYSALTYSDSLSAPVEAGTESGTITVTYGDDIIGSCTLVTTADIARSDFLYFLSEVKTFTSSRFFIGTVVTAVILSIAAIIWEARRREINMRRMTGRPTGRTGRRGY